MDFKSIKYRTEFKIDYNGLPAKVSTTKYDGKKIFRLAWPDGTLDFLLRENNKWDSYTISKEKQISDIGFLLEEKIN